MSAAEPGPTGHWKRSFFTIWTGQAFSLLGSSLAGFALVWWLTATTGSATVLAGATLMMILPQFLLGPLAGALVDRWSRRWVMITADSAIALFSLGLALLFLAGQARFWQVYIVLLMRAVGNAFHTPAMQASTPLMVPEKHLTRVAGLNQTFQGVMNMVSPPAAALLLALVPIYGMLLIDVITALLAVLPLFFIAVPNPARTLAVPFEAVKAATPSILQEIRQGLQFLAGWPGLLFITIMASVLNFMNVPAMSFIPLLVTRHFKLGALELGWMETAYGVGVITGGLLLGIWGGFRNRSVTMILGTITIGAGLLLCGLAPEKAFFLALVGNLIGPLASTMVSGLVFAMVQSSVPPELQGRVFSILLSAAAGMAPLGLAVAGPVVDRMGVQFWYLLAGAFALCSGMAGLLSPNLLQLEKKQGIKSQLQNFQINN